ncbi:anti-sigma B factor RsbW [Evansella cellulosilytica]|uniref:Serine-protein kinase RsbW n=1 Tax=Evansella cellulosilytica (strain ATCC 21833 / DSM 2522 / FERM P-1141 / JCM 9156 / N-4) TaxID=649639 RepID=E6TV50_EVAC2|nr:anti-sigma B factor RsbW [Evansella cellulosilytica]ADU28633.1 putative anti-sigma regulatory factor, serine/threonine protein kinase [Evansella cellulosilytica DSM 2522]
MTEAADKIQMKIPAKPEYVGVVRLTVSGIANRIGCSYDDIEDIKIAVAEACTNVVEHAYKDTASDPTILFSCSIFEDRLELAITDRGGEVDVSKFQNGKGPVNADQPVGDLKEGGLGLFLIETLMDKVEISSTSGVTIVMTKFLQRDEVELNEDRISTEVPKQ